MTGWHKHFWSLIVWCCLTQSAWAQARSIQEFVGLKEKWESYLGTQWRLEGRYGVIGDKNMRFENCDLDFRLPAGFVPGRWESKVIDVRGKLDRQQGRMIFLIEALSAVPDDMEQLSRRRSALAADDFAGWYALATWARERGTFYKDQKLITAAKDLDQQGVRVEFNKSTTRDETGQIALLETARRKQADDSLIREIQHEILWQRLRALQSQPFSAESYETMAQRVQSELPGAQEGLSQWPAELAASYLRQPRQVFGESDGARRKQLARVLYAEVLSARWQAELASDGGNGIEIARQLRASIPEKGDLAEKWQNTAIAGKRAKVPVMSRAAMTEFADELAKIGQAPQADAVRREWLTIQETRLAVDDARGRGDLAAAWLVLTADETQAHRLYSSAWKLNREFAQAQEWLTSHNYRLLGDQWVQASQIPATARSEMDAAIEAGRVLPQMTASQVKKALGTLPDSVTRMASAKKVVELWTYNSGFVIRLEREAQQAESRVISIQGTVAPRATP